MGVVGVAAIAGVGFGVGVDTGVGDGDTTEPTVTPWAIGKSVNPDWQVTKSLYIQPISWLLVSTSSHVPPGTHF